MFTSTVSKFSKSVKLKFHDKLFTWWEFNKRSLPWRKTTNTYKIMVSEFMLQQTQVNRVIPKYNAWMKQFPTRQTLLQATNQKIFAIWQGLGYNRRAIWLKEAIKLTDENFLWAPENLKEITGIGEYTARAIPIFAFNDDLVTVDTNIKNVLLHEKLINESFTTKQIWKTAEKLLPAGKSRDYHNALMDYGSTLKSKKPKMKTSLSKAQKFFNSTRDFRGRVIKTLVQNQPISAEIIASNCSIPKRQIDEILNGLLKDGLIKLDKNEFSL